MKTESKLQSHFSLRRELLTLVGVTLYCIGVNMFITSANLYSSSLLGVCQIIRTLLEWAGLNFGSLDISGILYYLINIPILVMAWIKIDRWFVLRTLLAVSVMSLLLTVLPTTALLPGDTLSACLLGGIFSGIGVGFVLRGSTTMGGGDLICMMIVRNHPNLSVGRLSLVINLIVYGSCMILFDMQTAIYSVVYAGVYSVALDYVHTQNIDVEVTIITKHPAAPIEQAIFGELSRGVTQLQGTGAYTDEQVNVLLIALSQYEVGLLRSIVRRFDPHAFFIVKDHVKIYGNYQRRL